MSHTSVRPRRSRPVDVAVFAILVALVPGLPALASAQQVELQGQIRPRSEARDPATPAGDGETFTSMRTRLGLTATLQENVRAFVQIQDVRTFGEETSTLGDFSAEGLDVHQAWVELGMPSELLGLRVGRQEATYGGERLIGAVNWTQQARSFDGARLRIGEPGARAAVDVFGFQLSESAVPGREADAAFLGAYATVDAGPERTLELYGLWNRSSLADEVADPADPDLEEGTAGGRYVARTGPVTYRVEGAWQFGERGGRDVSAWFFAARAGVAVAGGDGRVTLWYDHLSGDDPADDEVGVFNTLFATNHKFYGFADLFLDIPVHTAGRGLRDAAVKGSWTPAERWRVGLALHHFRVAEDVGLDSGHLADEVDLTVRYRLAPDARLSGGLSLVSEGDALGPVRGIAEDVTFGYVMLDVAF